MFLLVSTHSLGCRTAFKNYAINDYCFAAPFAARGFENSLTLHMPVSIQVTAGYGTAFSALLCLCFCFCFYLWHFHLPSRRVCSLHKSSLKAFDSGNSIRCSVLWLQQASSSPIHHKAFICLRQSFASAQIARSYFVAAIKRKLHTSWLESFVVADNVDKRIVGSSNLGKTLSSCYRHSCKSCFAFAPNVS